MRGRRAGLPHERVAYAHTQEPRRNRRARLLTAQVKRFETDYDEELAVPYNVVQECSSFLLMLRIQRMSLLWQPQQL